MKLSSENVKSIVGANLKSNNLDIEDNIINLILSTYDSTIKSELLKGNQVEISGVGTIVPSWRRVSDAFTNVPYTSKIKFNLDGSMKSEMNSRLATNPNYRLVVGAEEL